MGSWTRKPSEEVELLATIHPDSIAAAGSDNTGWIDVSGFSWIALMLLTGDFVATGVLDGTWEQATSVAGAGAKALASGAADPTQLTAAGSDDDKQVWMEFQTDQLDVNNGYRYVRFTIDETTAAAECAAILLGFGKSALPVGTDLFDEVVSLPA